VAEIQIIDFNFDNLEHRNQSLLAMNEINGKIFQIPFDYAQGDCQTEWLPNFIRHKVQMTESRIKAVISTIGEISSNKQISLDLGETR
jgi:hypothetical protein